MLLATASLSDNMWVLVLVDSSPVSLVNIKFPCEKVLSYQVLTVIKVDILVAADFYKKQ